MLVSPSSNRVYQQAAPQLAAAELAVTTTPSIIAEQVSVAGVDYLAFDAEPDALTGLGGQSSAMALFERTGDLLRPVELVRHEAMDSDLLTIPKYQGKTNELFTRLLLHVTTSQVRTGRAQLSVLDPLAGRGTTLLAAWTSGMNAYGVEVDEHSFEQFAAYLKGYLRRKRLKHSADISPVRREGRMIGRRFDAEVRPAETTHGHPGLPGAPELGLTFFTGDTADSGRLFGKKKFDAIVTDAPYGVVHGSARRGSSRQHTATAKQLDRSPAELLVRAVPVWASLLRPGGALGVSWNTYGLTHDEFAAICTDAGLQVCQQGSWLGFAHRVDSSIKRDILVALAPGQPD